MSWGIVAGAAISVVGGAIANNQSNKAAQGAANTQAQSAKDANAVQLQMYNQSRQDNEPFRQNALTAQQEYMTLLGLGQPQPAPQGVSGQTNVSGVFANNPLDGDRQAAQRPFAGYNPKLGGFGDTVQPFGAQTFTEQPQQPAAPALNPQEAQQSAFDRFRNTPGYQFGLQTGFNQVQSSAAARGGLLSGATLKALQKFGNDYADQQGYTPYMNRLASLAGMGQTANAQNAQMGMNYANQAGNNLISAGNARASGLQTIGNNNAQLAAGTAGAINGVLGYYNASRVPQTTNNYNWASSSSFGNNYGGWY